MSKASKMDENGIRNKNNWNKFMDRYFVYDKWTQNTSEDNKSIDVIDNNL